jgi:hypothetical protein
VVIIGHNTISVYGHFEKSNRHFVLNANRAGISRGGGEAVQALVACRHVSGLHPFILRKNRQKLRAEEKPHFVATSLMDKELSFKW